MNTIEIIADKDGFIPDTGDWWYFHGDLERDLGYDKGSITNITPPIVLDGEYEVKVKGIERPCVGYFWMDTMKRLRGYVCYRDDIEAVGDAKKKYEEKPWMI